MKSTITEKITQELRKEIITGVYPASTVITEISVSEKFGGSKTPSREALGNLCSEGLLEKIPGTGYLIESYSILELDALLELRSILERAIIDLAIKRAAQEDIQKIEQFCDQIDLLSQEEFDEQCVLLNREFHIRLAELSKNPFIVSTMANIMDKMRVAMSFDTNTERLMAGHREILAAIRDKDQEMAAKWVNRFLNHRSNCLVGCFLRDL